MSLYQLVHDIKVVWGKVKPLMHAFSQTAYHSFSLDINSAYFNNFNSVCFTNIFEKYKCCNFLACYAPSVHDTKMLLHFNVSCFHSYSCGSWLILKLFFLIQIRFLIVYTSPILCCSTFDMHIQSPTTTFILSCI